MKAVRRAQRPHDRNPRRQQQHTDNQTHRPPRLAPIDACDNLAQNKMLATEKSTEIRRACLLPGLGRKVARGRCRDTSRDAPPDRRDGSGGKRAQAKAPLLTYLCRLTKDPSSCRPSVRSQSSRASCSLSCFCRHRPMRRRAPRRASSAAPARSRKTSAMRAWSKPSASAMSPSSLSASAKAIRRLPA